MHSHCSLHVSLGSCCHNKYFLTNTAQIAACLHVHDLSYSMHARFQVTSTECQERMCSTGEMTLKSQVLLIQTYLGVYHGSLVSLVTVLSEASITKVTAL